MRKELKGYGIDKDTGELRDSYLLDSIKTSLTYLSAGDPPQEPHKHLLVSEATQVLFGEVDIYAGRRWNHVGVRHGVEFERRELHNMRASSKIKERISFGLPIINVTGLTITTKWVAPYLKVRKDEVMNVLNYDWFHKDYERYPTDPRNSPLTRQTSEVKRRFWNIVKRNESLLGTEKRY